MIDPLDPDDPRALGEFTLNGRLGEGGQGVVFLGWTPGGEPVAVKVLKSGFDSSVKERLARELDAMRGVAPFCTARVLTAVVDGPMPYVVSEFIDGPSLQRRVGADGPLRGGELERLAVGTATALTAIHAAGIVHRDFKPGNVLLGPDGPRVVDFGIARHSASDTITAGPVGTPAYLAPEQIAGRPATPAADVFAWGATIIFAATGRAAFGADSVPAVMNRILTAEPDASGLPEPLRGVVERCLAKDPAHRPASRDVLLELVGSAPDPLRAGVAAAATRPEGVRRGGKTTAVLTAVPATTPGSAEAAGAGERGSRAGIVIGAVAAVAALSVTAALLVPRLLSDERPSPTSAADATTIVSPAAASPASPADQSQGVPPSGAVPTPGAVATSDDSVTEDDGVVPDDAVNDDDGGSGATTATPTTTPGGTVPAALAGTWGGHIEPTEIVGGSDETDVQIVLAPGKDTGGWRDVTTSCRATLRLTRSSDTALVFRLDECAAGKITLVRTGDGLAYRWDGSGGDATYLGTLVRD
ncbi:serine/threonine-protein kinase [Sphaerimonospora sp. CA-214678]|uniref:serine/threonine-protein kinase n=1 Tax=Sphaerimonospora sp. CA-214678 TaxID=3240029 RepID=UPI003D8EDB25